ncbi:MAG: BrnA antitoxin family protein [Pyrinomonadaceae bacterium]
MNKKDISQRSETDWARIDAMKDEEIDFSDIPRLTPEFFANGILRRGLKPIAKKSQLTLRIDQDVIEFFRGEGRGYQTKINQLLRAYMDAHTAK